MHPHIDQCMGPKGMGAPVAMDVSGHRALKKLWSKDMVVSLGVENKALQTTFNYLNKILNFIKDMTNLKINKMHKISKNMWNPLNYSLNEVEI